MSSMGVVIKQVKGKTGESNGRNLRATVLYIDNASGHGDKIHFVNGQAMMGSINILAADDDRVAQLRS